MANSMDPDQTAPIGAACSGSTLFPSIPNWSVMLGNVLQQTTSANDIFRCIFSVPNSLMRVKIITHTNTYSIYELLLKYFLTLNALIAAKVVCFSRLLKYLRGLYGKQYGPRSDCSYRSSLLWVHAVSFYT